MPEASKAEAQVDNVVIRTKAGASHDFAPGSIFADKFEILEELGVGGMGRVFKVRHVVLGTFLALKILNSHPSTDSARRFVQEAKLIARLRHPNIVSVHDFGTWGDRAYLVMDYLQGRTLTEVLEKEGSLGLQRFQSLILQICGALAHAHEAGIVHRDIKPANVIVVSAADGAEQAMVVDFGLAKATESGTMQSLTNTGAIMGTPIYMSPEQLQGLELDARTDLYSLGCVMYELLVGQPPHQRGEVIATFYSHLNEIPKPFPRTLRSTLAGRQLESITFKCLAKRPEDRHQSALELAADLKQTERHSKGIFNSLILSWKYTEARRNCSPKSGLPPYALPLLSVLALVLAAYIQILPPQIIDASSQIDCNRSIMAVIDDLKNSITRNDSDPNAEHNMLIRGARGNKLAEAQFDQLLRQYPSAAEKKEDFERTMSNDRAVIRSAARVAKKFATGQLWDIEETMKESIHTCADFMVDVEQLRLRCVEDLTEQTHRLQSLCTTLVLVWCGAIIIGPSLAVATLLSFREKVRWRSAKPQ